jgi:DNA-binding XRE family transcriptional regulator
MGKSSLHNTSEKWKESMKSRSTEWAKKAAQGKLDSALHPSRIKLLRLAKKLAQSEIARKLSLKVATYAQIERGRRHVDKKRAEVIANFLGKPIEFLFDKEKHKDSFSAIRIDALTQKKI